MAFQGSVLRIEHIMEMQAMLASGSGVGPFARLRAGAAIDTGAYIGNFVELKGARVGQGGNVCHLSYLGDADVGDRANIGAGTITCNYSKISCCNLDPLLVNSSAVVGVFSCQGDGFPTQGCMQQQP